jgi:hypothetical protein
MRPNAGGRSCRAVLLMKMSQQANLLMRSAENLDLVQGQRKWEVAPYQLASLRGMGGQHVTGLDTTWS